MFRSRWSPTSYQTARAICRFLIVVNGPVFEDGFSVAKAIEYPIDQDPESYLDDNDFKLYRSPTGLKVRLSGTKVTAAAKARVTWTARHLADASTVYAGDFDAVCCLAASIAFEQLAAKYTQSGDALVSADVVNYRTKNQEYLALSKAMFKRYADHVDLNGGDASGAGSPQKAALSIGDMDNVTTTGQDRMIHGRTNAMTFSIKFEGATKLAPDALAAFEEGARNGLEKTALKGLSILQLKTPVALGFLVNSEQVSFDWTVPRATLFAGPPADVYALPVETGSKAHMPPPEALIPWVMRKIGASTEKEALSIAWAIATNIKKRGTQGAHMFQKTEPLSRDGCRKSLSMRSPSR
jgi:hypothetical protein